MKPKSKPNPTQTLKARSHRQYRPYRKPREPAHRQLRQARTKQRPAHRQHRLARPTPQPNPNQPAGHPRCRCPTLNTNKLCRHKLASHHPLETRKNHTKSPGNLSLLLPRRSPDEAPKMAPEKPWPPHHLIETKPATPTLSYKPAKPDPTYAALRLNP